MKNNKKKILFTSIVTIAICFCLITGSTYALFTDTTTTNIAVTSGKVELVASVIGTDDAENPPVLYSISPVSKNEALEDPADEDSLKDGYFKAVGVFEYKDGSSREETFYYTGTGALKNDDGTYSTTFPNGGTAGVDSQTGVVTFDNITPGDKMEFNVAITDNSDVKIKIRYIIKPVNIDDELVSGFTVSYGGEEQNLTSGGVTVSDWISVDPSVDNFTSGKLSIGLKASAGNDYQDTEFNFVVIVEAIQDNATN